MSSKSQNQNFILTLTSSLTSTTIRRNRDKAYWVSIATLQGLIEALDREPLGSAVQVKYFALVTTQSNIYSKIFFYYISNKHNFYKVR